MRREIDLQITLENQMEELRQDREGEIVEIMKETSFLIEVCNLLVEERSEYEYQLAELRKAAEEDAEAYERAFHELVAVEERNKAHRQELNESIDKLTEELALTVKDRQKAEREVAAMQNKVDGAEESEMVKENSGLRQQLKEFETYFELFSKIVGSSDVNEIERYVCGEGGERFQLYEMIQNKQNAMRELAKEKAELIEKLDTLIKGTKNERHDREELRQMQDELARVQKETESIEQQAQKTSAMLSSAAVCLEKIFSSIGCTAPKLVLPSAGITPSQHVVHELFAAIERRVEEYIITWMEKDPKRTKNPSPPLPLNSTTGCSASVSKTAMSFGNVGCAEETLMTPMLAAETGETAPFVDVDENNDGEGVFSKEEH
uniref:ODAD1 central coiled coil region domain-containing protein n=1 Tax=Trypanosoma congolense (strain IL3000) TaxID=1068625 RepID=G0UQI9_TRYCI|nr:conserved hypothetical protein [Trypanosoma congolense IL3000]